MDKSSLAKRMKENYEKRSQTKLTKRIPTIMRFDGRAFHSYTRGLKKPYDEELMDDMRNTAIRICEELGAKCAYVQSDEISILLTDTEKNTTEAIFDYKVQKLTSVGASIATAEFNRLRTKRIIENRTSYDVPTDIYDAILDAKLAQFDARIFQVPEGLEVCNYFLWRQRDAIKNSIQMLGQSLFSQKELHKKNTDMVLDMCYEKAKKENNSEYKWHGLSTQTQRGAWIIKQPSVGIICTGKDKGKEFIRYKFGVQEDTPFFEKDRDCVLELLKSKTKE